MWLHKCWCWYEIGWDHVQRLRKMGLWHTDLTGVVELDWKLVPRCLRFGLCYCTRNCSVPLCITRGTWVFSVQHKPGSLASSKYKPNCFVAALSNCTASTWWLFLNTPVAKFLFTEDVFLDLLFWMCANRFKITCFYQMYCVPVSLNCTKVSLIPPIRLFLLANDSLLVTCLM